MINQAILESLLESGLISIRRGRIFDYEFLPKNQELDFSKIEAMLLGVAIGDSLGNSTESMFPSRRRALYGEITDYLPRSFSSMARGFPSDDTQMTFWTLEHLLEHDGSVPGELAKKFTQEKIYGIGATVREFISNFKAGKGWEYIQDMLRRAVAQDWSVRKACDSWWSGAYLLETLPSVFYIMIKHGHDPERAIMRAVNDTKDNDTVASIVGALVGAIHGKDGFPQRWLNGLTGKTRVNDDGRVFQLIRLAEDRWGKAGTSGPTS